MAVCIVLAACAGAWIVGRAASRAVELRRRLVCASQIKNLGTTLKIYSSAGLRSPEASIEWAITTGLVDAGATVCPSSGSAKSNYVFVGTPDGISLANTTVIMYEPKSNHGGEGGNVLFADGHAQFVSGAEYDRLIAFIERADLETRPVD